jgi:hypothetical protein
VVADPKARDNTENDNPQETALKIIGARIPATINATLKRKGIDDNSGVQQAITHNTNNMLGGMV